MVSGNFHARMNHLGPVVSGSFHTIETFKTDITSRVIWTFALDVILSAQISTALELCFLPLLFHAVPLLHLYISHLI